MFKKTQFSPNTPNGLLNINGLAVPSSSNTPNNLFRHHHPGGVKNNHFDCESNFDEVFYDEARSQFRETIKS